MSCQSLSVVGGGKETTGDVSEIAAATSCGTFHRSVRFSSESHSSRRGCVNDVFRRDSPGSSSLSVLAPVPAIPRDAFDRSAHLRASLPTGDSSQTMSQSAPSAFYEAIGDVTPPRPAASNGGCRFPRLDECAHFHYERVCLGGISVEIVKDECFDISLAAHSSSSDGELPSVESGLTEGWVTLKVRSHILNNRDQEDVPESSQCPINPSSNNLESVDNFEWIVTRSAENFRMLDTMLHRCIYDRKVSGLTDLSTALCPATIEERTDYEFLISDYLHHLSIIADDSINCGPVLNWFQMDNKGHRLLVANEDTNSINTPAVAAAYSVRRYVSQARDEISFEVGDMISIIDMPGPSESIWWRGKRGFRVGFFPHHCVAVIGDKVPRHMTQPPPIVGSVAVSPIKPVLRKHGKLISLFRSFILARPSRRSLKQQGILRERVFGCDLGEHLLNSGRSVPLVLSACAALIEKHGVVDGIYRLSGATSLTQRLRRSFDDDSMAVEPPELLSSPAILHDVHAVASLIKMYFRELPNPLCTYQLYDHFVCAVQGRVTPPPGLDIDITEFVSIEPKPDDTVKLRLMRDVVMKLPPPHYRTMSHLMRHLRRMSLMGAATGMTARNMAIVWAPNLLREPRPHRALQGVAVQAVVTEFLICYAEELFSEEQQQGKSSPAPSTSTQRGDSDQIPAGIEIRPNDTIGRRPKSLPLSTPTKLLSLEEARNRGGNSSQPPPPIQAPNPILSVPDAELRPTVNKEPKYIEVGGGPNNLPQYHTVIELPQQGSSKRGLKRSPSGWRGLFFRAKYQRPPQQAVSSQAQHHRPQISSPFAANGAGTETTQSLRTLDCSPKASALFPLPSRATAASVGSGLASIEKSSEPQSVLRPVKSCESLHSESDVLGPLTAPGSNAHTNSKQHSRSASCDSYFEPWQMELAGMRLRLSPQERDGNLFSEEDDTITISRKAQSAGNPSALLPTSSDTSAEQSPKRGSRPEQLRAQAVIVREELDVGAADRKRTRLEDQLLDILYIDCNTPDHGKTSDPKMEQDPADSRTKGSPEKRHSDTYDDTPSSSKECIESDVSNVPGNTDAKRICKNGQVSSNQVAVDSPTSVLMNVKLRERGSPRKQKISSIRYSGLHNPINLNVETKPQGKIVKIVNQLDQNNSRSSWHGLSKGNSHSTLIKIDWTGDNLISNTGASSPNTPVTPNYDLLESESEVSDADKHVCKCSNESRSCEPDWSKSTDIAPTDTLKDENSIESFERSNTNSPVNISYQALNRLSELSAASSNSTDKEHYQKSEASSRDKTNDLEDYEQISVESSTAVTVSNNAKVNLVIDDPKDDLSGCSPSKDDIYECFNFARPNYINLQSSPSSKSSSVSPSNPNKSPIRSTISITYKSPRCKDQSYEHFDNYSNAENESIYEEVVPNPDFLPAVAITDDKTFGNDLIILESPENSHPPLNNESETDNLDDSLDLYSQVKCFRKSVHEVNALLKSPNTDLERETNIITKTEHSYENLQFDDNIMKNTYENVPVGKLVSPVVGACLDRRVLDQGVKYANLNILESPKLEEQTIVEKMQVDEVSETTIVDPLLSPVDNLKARWSTAPPKPAREKPNLNISKESQVNDNGNFVDKSKVISSMNVRKLANRFESPTEPKSAFSFPKPSEQKTASLERSKKDTLFERTKASSVCEGRNRETNRKVPCIRAKGNRLIKNSTNTRSLDENAFEKEFGSTPYTDRRKSLEAMCKPIAPKLPDMNLNTDRDVDKENVQSYLKLNLNLRRSSCKSEDQVSPEPCERYISITPTTENKISLVQARFSPKKESKYKYSLMHSKDENSCEPISLDNNLISFVEESDKSKLSRERIEKYKEERRNFLREKYSSQSFRGINEINQSLPVLVKLRKHEDTTLDGSENEVQLRHPEKLDRLLLKDVFQKSDPYETGTKFERRNTTDAAYRPKYNSGVSNPSNFKFGFKNVTSNVEPREADEAPNFADIARKFSVDASKPRRFDDFSNRVTDRMAMSWDLSSSKKQTSLPFIRSEIVEHVKKDQSYTKFPARSTAVGDQRSPLSESKPPMFSSNEKQQDKRSPSFNIKDVTAMFEQKSNVKN